MAASRIEEFTTAVRGVDGSVTHTPASEFSSTLAAVVSQPAVGTPLPFEGVDYEGVDVESPPTGGDLAGLGTGVTAGTLGIANYGSVVLAESGRGEELLGLYADLHVVVVAASDVVADMPEAFDRLGDRLRADRADAIIATGPSATADMGAVVTGVHGPRDVHVIVLEDR